MTREEMLAKVLDGIVASFDYCSEDPVDRGWSHLSNAIANARLALAVPGVPAQQKPEPDCWRWRYLTPNYGWSKWIGLSNDEISAFRDLQGDRMDAGTVELQALFALSSTESGGK